LKLLIKNAKLRGRENLCQISVESDKISVIALAIDANADRVIDAQGCLVLPPFVETHIHLDTAFTVGSPRYNQSGSLLEGIQIWKEKKQTLTVDDIVNRADQAVRWLLCHGVLFIRTHSDVSDPDLKSTQALLQIQEKWKDYVTIEMVAFPQDGIFTHDKGEKWLRNALKMGVEVVGGIPHCEMTREDGLKEVQLVFDLAEEFKRKIDFHADETDDDHSRFIETIAAEAIRRELFEQVTVSHATAMHSYNNAYAFKLMGLLARSKINIIANPFDNITLQGRFDHYPIRRGMTRVKELLQNGINVAIGHDSIMDPWYPLGYGNPLSALNMVIHVCQLTGQSEMENSLSLITDFAAKTFGIPSDQYGIEVGRPANMVITFSPDPVTLIRKPSLPRYVISKGNVIAENKREQGWLNVFEHRLGVNFD
jgi:cytosine deaminase